MKRSRIKRNDRDNFKKKDDFRSLSVSRHRAENRDMQDRRWLRYVRISANASSIIDFALSHGVETRYARSGLTLARRVKFQHLYGPCVAKCDLTDAKAYGVFINSHVGNI